MKFFFLIIFVFTTFFGLAQNYITSGIVAYHSHAYDRTIKDMDQAFLFEGELDNQSKAKAHYYRGMSRLMLVKAGEGIEVVGYDPYLKIFKDLSKANELDPKWESESRDEIESIYQQLYNSAKSFYQKGIYAVSEGQVSKLLGAAVIKLRAATEIKPTFEAKDLLAKTYDAIGIFYDQLVDDEQAKKKAVSSYESALSYHEQALALKPGSIENIKALKQLSYRLGDRDREMKYAQMESNIGG